MSNNKKNKVKFKDISTAYPGIYIRGNVMRANISFAQITKRVTVKSLPTTDGMEHLVKVKKKIEAELKLNKIQFLDINSTYVTSKFNNLLRVDDQQIMTLDNTRINMGQFITIEKVDNTEFVDVLLDKQIENYRSRIADKGYQRGKIVITTFLDYQRYIRYLIPHFVGIRIGELSKLHVANFIDQHELINFETVLDYLIPLKAIVKFHHEVESISKNIFADQFLRNYAIQTCKDEKRAPLPYTDKELSKIRIAVHSHIRDLALFATLTGMRVGELIALRWRNIDLNKRKIYVVVQFTKNQFKRLKSEHGRRVLPITDEIMEILQHLKNLPIINEFVFVDPHNHDKHWLNSTKINKALNKFHLSLEIMPRCFHNTRKTYAKNDLKKENDVYGTSGRLGHKNPQETINSYLEIVQEGFEDYVEDSFLKNLVESDDYG